ncbi:MAG: hypothetical protein ACRD33_11290, partial [Candidatus Acidiferrales bacterium]
MTRVLRMIAVTAGALIFSSGLSSAARAQGPRPTAGTESGIAVFEQHCMICHGNPNVPRAPQPSVIRQMSP